MKTLLFLCSAITPQVSRVGKNRTTLGIRDLLHEIEVRLGTWKKVFQIFFTPRIVCVSSYCLQFQYWKSKILYRINFSFDTKESYFFAYKKIINKNIENKAHSSFQVLVFIIFQRSHFYITLLYYFIKAVYFVLK